MQKRHFYMQIKDIFVIYFKERQSDCVILFKLFLWLWSPHGVVFADWVQ